MGYLKENDENCKESTTLILIIVIGLLVALSIVGFLAIRNNSSVKYKGAHTTYEHSSNRTILDMVWGKWTWLQNLYLDIDQNNTMINETIFHEDAQEIQAIVAIEEELNNFQPIYRNPLLQKLYATQSSECMTANNGDDNLYNFISIKHGAWIPSETYLKEAVDFSWADFQSQDETEDQELEQTISSNDMTKDEKKHKDELTEKIKSDRKQRKKKKKKQQKAFKEMMKKTAKGAKGGG